MKVSSVSVPSFGDSFFICGDFGERYDVTVFPSPHSGILFLLEREAD